MGLRSTEKSSKEVTLDMLKSIRQFEVISRTVTSFSPTMTPMCCKMTFGVNVSYCEAK
jgi:hypothetical protein